MGSKSFLTEKSVYFLFASNQLLLLPSLQSILWQWQLQSRTQSLQASYPADQKTWRLQVRDWWHREASAEGRLVKNQWWSTRIFLSHFCTFQLSLNLIIGCVYDKDLELVYHSAIEFKCPWQIGLSIGLNGIIFYFFVYHCKWY